MCTEVGSQINHLSFRTGIEVMYTVWSVIAPATYLLGLQTQVCLLFDVRLVIMKKKNRSSRAGAKASCLAWQVVISANHNHRMERLSRSALVQIFSSMSPQSRKRIKRTFEWVFSVVLLPCSRAPSAPSHLQQ